MKNEDRENGGLPADRRKRILGKSLASLFFSAALLIAVICFSFSYGWFSLSMSVSGSDMTAGTKYDCFDLAVSGEQETLFAADSPILSFLAEEENGGYEKISSTYDGHASIVCNLINDNPLVAGTEELSPGSYGRISFDIVPDETSPERFLISLNPLPLDIEDGQIVPVDASELEELKTLFSGHILFFLSRSALTNGGYYYSEHIDDGSFVFDLSEHTPVTVNGKEHYTVEFYWIWPLTFSQLAYAQNDPRLHTHALAGDEATRADMVAYVKANPEQFFKGLSSTVNLNAQDFENYYFVELSDAYNTADQFIGEEANFLALKISVLSAS